jgi:predicted RND superfamily exporter protein
MASARVAGLWRRVADFSTRRARSILAAVGVATLGFCYCLSGIETDTDLDGFVRPEARELADTIEDDFDEGGQLVLIFESRSERSLLEPELLHKQLRIIRELKSRYDLTTHSLVEGIDEGLKRIKGKSLLDYDDYSPIAEGILGLAGGRTVRDLEKVSRHLTSQPEAIAFYAKLRLAAAMGLSGSGPGAKKTRYGVPFVKAIQAFVRVGPGYSKDERKQVLTSIPGVAQSMGRPEINVFAVNDQLMSYELDQRSRQNGLVLGLSVLLVDALCLWALFRSGRELLVVFSILATATIWTFGACALLGVRLSFFHLVALPILLGTAIDDAVVFGCRLAEERAAGKPPEEALRATLEGIGNAIFLTTFTTLIAFLITGLTANTDIVASFFLLVAFSMAVVFVLDILLQGAIRTELVRWDQRVARPEPVAPSSLLDASTRMLTDPARRLIERPGLVLLANGFLMLIALPWAAQLQSEMRRGDFVRPGMQTYAANESLKRYFGESRVGYVLVTGDVENPVLLEKMTLLTERLAGNPAIQQVLGTANVESVVDLIGKLRLAITPGTSVRTIFDQIARSEKTANHVLNVSYREAAEHVLRKSGDRYDGLLMRFYPTGARTTHVLAASHAIERQLEELGFYDIPGIEIRIGGGDIAYSIEAAYYVDLLVRSFFLSLVANWVVLLVIWKRVGLSLIAMTPVVLAVTVVMGLMGAFGIRLTVLTVAVGAIAVGLGIDYPIHMIERFQEESRNGRRSPAEAATTCLRTMGPRFLAAALTTIVGFGAASALALPMAVSFGLLTGAAIGLVYLASIFVLPVLLVWFETSEQSSERETGTSAI